jgi:hypothetical protein
MQEERACVALSADGDTAIVDGPSDNRTTGAAWVFTTQFNPRREAMLEPEAPWRAGRVQARGMLPIADMDIPPGLRLLALRLLVRRPAARADTGFPAAVRL